MSAFIFVQPWLNFAGLILDFIGVALLAVEWRIAMRAERREIELEAQEARREMPPSMRRNDSPHRETFDWMDRQRDARQKARRAAGAFSARSGWFILAFIAIATGFLLQILGSLPLDQI